VSRDEGSSSRGQWPLAIAAWWEQAANADSMHAQSQETGTCRFDASLQCSQYCTRRDDACSNCGVRIRGSGVTKQVGEAAGEATCHERLVSGVVEGAEWTVVNSETWRHMIRGQCGHTVASGGTCESAA
jgi:hypothetical protein